MLINLIKHAWQSLTKSSEAQDLRTPHSPQAADEASLREHLLKFPQDTDCWYRLGAALVASQRDHTVSNQANRDFWATVKGASLAHMANQHDCALTLYRRAMDLDSRYAGQLLVNIGVVLKELVRLTEAIECYERSIALHPDLAESHYNLGLTLYETGRIDEAERSLREAIRLRPEFQAAHSALLCIYGFNRNQDPDCLYAEHRRWAVQYADPLTPKQPRFDNVLDDDRRLTVGYVSADLREHSVSFFIEPVLAHHDRQAFRILCYDNWHGQDRVNLRLRRYTDDWIKIDQMSDEEVAARIRSDHVDILIDLSGHTTGNRLLAFARKPAPIQVSWLGYMCTTGMQAMDFRISDAYLDPPGLTEKYYTEKLVRLTSAAVFEASPEAPPVNALPARGNGGNITFASLNNYAKISDEVIATWVSLLQALPTSSLLLVALGGDEPAIQEKIRQRFLRLAGTGNTSFAERIKVRGRRPLAQFLAMFHEIDVALDPFPYSGGTTSLHTLWMGVPIITMEGKSELSRSTSGMMRACGLDQLIAPDQENYLKIAVDLALDLERLSAIRASLRSLLISSCISNSVSFTRELEAAYRTMWSNFVTRRSARAA